ncbi:ankyrin, partial [Aspergillus sclerotiicarbonarius CBS 121057]
MGQEGIIKTLVNNGVLINEGVRYSSPLEAAAYHGQLGTVELLLQLGADYNIYKASQRGYGSALNAAAAEGHVAVVRALIAAGTDIDLGRHDKSGDTAVSIAARHGHSAVVRDLV